MGGIGSGSKKGTQASNWKDGRWKNMAEMRKKAKPGQVVGHVKPVTRDSKNHNIVGPPTSKNSGTNMRLISKSQNAKEARGNKGGRVNRRATHR